MTKLDRFRGCLIAGAAGDALGYAVEFRSEKQINQKYGSSGITSYDLVGGKALISDDTQMTLFTANALLLDTAQTDAVQNIANCYKEWYQTQFVTCDAAKGQYAWLMIVPGLFARRAPGDTCLKAIAQGANGTIEHPLNDRKGCGGVMRVAPIGLYYSGSKLPIAESDMIGAKAAAITHGHDLGYIPAAALVHIIRMIVENEEMPLKEAVQDSIRAMNEFFPTAPHIRDFIGLMQKAVTLAESDRNDLDAIHELGEGWVAEETLAIAVFCALRHEHDLERALIASVNHKGDSDSTGAVTGTILGAYLGIDAIPEKFRKDLELYEVILEVAEDLCEGEKLGDEVWISKYIEHNYRR
jgi:ADP-ribosylglycohydrolase